MIDSLASNTATHVGVLLTRVPYFKTNEAVDFNIVDTAKTNLFGPPLCDTDQGSTMVHLQNLKECASLWRPEGSICESSGVFEAYQDLGSLRTSDLMALYDIAAYCATNPSPYSLHSLIPEARVVGVLFRVIRGCHAIAKALLQEKTGPWQMAD